MQNGYIALDVGGTKILGVLFDENFKPIKRTKKPSKTLRGTDKVLEQLMKVIDELFEDSEVKIKAIGIGVPGIIDSEGTIVFTPNMPWTNYPLKKILEEEYKVPVYLGNDANLAMYGEFKFGSAKGVKNAVGYFIGTGIGGGLIIDGKLYMGAIGAAGEIGHTPIIPNGPYCGCGAQGCLEALASKTGIQKAFESQIKRGRKTEITESLNPEDSIIKSSALKKAYTNNDELTKEILEDAARYIGISAASVINLLNPELIVLGGGVMESLGDELLPMIIEHAKTYSIPQNFDSCKFTLAELSDDACIYGALGIIEK